MKLLTPLRDNRDFRMLWVGRGASFLGSEFTRVAVPFQVYRITGSSLAVGLVALAELVPLLVFSMVGGVLADSRDRRQILIRCHVGLAVVSGLFALNASLDRPRLWALFVLAAAAAALSSLSVPAVTALVPRLVPTEQFPAAAALQAAYANLGFILGPPLAGVVIASLGLSAAYLIDMASFLLAIGTLVAMRTTGAAGGADRVSLRAVAEGFRFLRGRPVLQGTYLLDFDAMVFGMPTALFPALVVTRFHGSARVLGLLYAAPAAGALLANLSAGAVGRVRRQGRAIALSIAVRGVAIVAFGLSGPLWLALVALAVAGGADMVSGVYRMTIWNTTIPDHVRGRLAGIEWANVNSGPVLGDLEAGVVAALTSVRFSIVSGGVACLVGLGVMAAFMPAFLGYDSAEPSP